MQKMEGTYTNYTPCARPWLKIIFTLNSFCSLMAFCCLECASNQASESFPVKWEGGPEIDLKLIHTQKNTMPTV